MEQESHTRKPCLETRRIMRAAREYLLLIQEELLSVKEENGEERHFLLQSELAMENLLRRLDGELKIQK